MLIYGNIRDLAYVTYKFDTIFSGHFDFIIKSVVSVLLQFSEPIHPYAYVESWVSKLKFIRFIKDDYICPEMPNKICIFKKQM